MPSPQPFRMELLEETTDSFEPPPGAPARAASPDTSLKEAQLRQAEQRILQLASQQQKTALYIQTLLTLLGARSLLLLALLASTGLCLVILMNPEATLPKMILAAATSALMILPIVLVILRKG
jgi:hypothetical protein